MDAPTNKDKIEAMCREAGLRPERRLSMQGFDLLLADGFSLPPHAAWGKFGVDPDEYPFGCYVTIWWVMKGEDRHYVAQPLFFDAFHDRQLDIESKKRARLNAAEKSAAEFLDRRKRNIH